MEEPELDLGATIGEDASVSLPFPFMYPSPFRSALPLILPLAAMAFRTSIARPFTDEEFRLHREFIPIGIAGMRPAGKGSGEYGALETLSDGVMDFRSGGMNWLRGDPTSLIYPPPDEAAKWAAKGVEGGMGGRVSTTSPAWWCSPGCDIEDTLEWLTALPLS